MSADIQHYGEDDQRLVAMMEEQKHVQQRITTVETTVVQHDRRLSLVELTQNDLKNIVASMSASFEKLTDIQGIQGQKTAINEAAIVAIRERTDTFADRMEKITEQLTNRQEDTGLKISQLETKVSFAQAIGLSGAGILLTILIQHVFTALGGK